MGEGLCDLLNVLSPGSVSKIHRGASSSAFARRENVSFFLDACRKHGLRDLFETRDLDSGDERAVAMTMAKLSNHFDANPPFVLEKDVGKKLPGFDFIEMSEAMPQPRRSRQRRREETAVPAAPPAPREDEGPTTKVTFSKDRIVVHWPWQRKGDERFDGVVAAFEDEEFSKQVAELKRAPGAKLKMIQHGTKTVLSSEDDEGNCCELEISM